MSHFLDEEAVESEDEELSDAEERSKVTKKKAVMLSSDEDEEDEDDEEKAREEMKGFIASDDEDERSGSDSGGGGGARRRKAKRRHSRGSDRSDNNEDIDEEDLELLKENLGINIKKQRKRIRMDSDDEDEENGDSRSNLPDPEAGSVGQGEADDGDGYASDDVNDFIVDEDGRPIAKERKKRHHIFSDSARQKAEDIFGVAFDYGEFAEYDEDAEDAEEEEEEDYESEEDEDGERRKKERVRRRRRPVKTIFDTYEPRELELRHYTDRDNEIRNTDIPERMQLRSTPVTSLPEGAAEEELEREADWIFRHGFTKETLSRQDGYTREECHNWHRKEDKVVEKIKKALDFMRQQFHEVPFIAFYRKEYVLPELKINDLWRVYKMDELWCKLQTRKCNLKKLYENMMMYQGETIMADPDKPIPEGMRILTNEDVKKVENIDSFEELKDRDQHFKLYFSRDMEPMQEMLKKKKKEEREARKIRQKGKKKRYKTITNEDGEEVEVTDEEAMEVDDEEDELPEDAEKDDDGETQDQLKFAKRNDPYSLCRKYGLVGIATRFGLSAEHFGENLKDGYQKVDVDQDPAEPAEVAAEYTNEKFPKSEDVLMAAKYLMAAQIAHDPVVRKEVRDAFYERATLDVTPTKKGLQEIDENHDCYSIKFLRKKPIRDLVGEQWLKLIQAEEQKLVTINLAPDIPALSAQRSLLEEAQDLFKHDAFSKSVQEWNSLRAQCVEMAFKNMLYPMLRKELKIKLTREAKDGVIRACRSKLYEWIKVGKYTVNFEDEDEDEWDSSHGCRIMAIMYENDASVAAYAVMITVDGDFSALLKLENILKRKNSWNENERFAKEKDLASLKNFIIQHRPHGIVVGAADRAATGIKMDVEDVLKTLEDDEHQFPHIRVFLMDDNLAKVYANSERANQDFRDYPNVLRQAISLARRFQDPLLEFSQLTGPENEILCLRYHQMQDVLSEEELLEGLSIEFINRTNEVGVDINKCVTHPSMSNLVQFVGGLGPRKAAALLKTLRQMQSSQRLESREQLVSLCHMGPQGLMNCAGFIKIDASSVGDSDVEVLDCSRIHIEAYEWARKMAVDALEYDEGDGKSANALEEILLEPDKLGELDLDAFADELERQGFGKKSITLCDIRSELYNRYKDLREPFKEPDAEEEFNLVTKETPQTFYIGKLVTAVVTGFAYKAPQGEELDNAVPLKKDNTNLWQCPFCGQDDFPELTEVWPHIDNKLCPGKAVGVRIRLDNGVSGFIPIKNLSDKQVINPEERVRVNMTIYCRITKIQPERFSVEAISKTSALVDEESEWKPAKDDYYDYELEKKMTKQETEKKKEKERQSYMCKRVIAHQSFLNIGYKEAETRMANMEQGDVIIRPSSKGEDRLTVTWKVHDNIYQHIDVKEKNKVNTFDLGQSLWINNEEFEDLDEIIARHITPMAAHARDILNFRYYRETQGGKRDVAEQMLMSDKSAQPNKIHYFLSASKELPGKFMLSYLPRRKARHEFVTVTPEGFRFRKQNFENVNSLIKWFKEHFRDPIPGTPATPGGRLTNRTPYLTGTPTGHGGGITPGAMSMAAGTPYAHTPVGFNNVNTPYTPSGQTPILTPYNTPGPSMTPRGAATGSGHNTPKQQRRAQMGVFGAQTSRSGFGPAGQTPVMTPYNTPGPSRGSGINTPRGNGQMPPAGYGGQRPPPGGGGSGGRHPRDDRRYGGSGSSAPGAKRTPKGGFGDATPLYDE